MSIFYGHFLIKNKNRKFYILFFLVLFFLSCEAFREAPPVIPVAPAPPAGGYPQFPAGTGIQEIEGPSSTTDFKNPPTEWGVINCNESEEEQTNFNIALGHYVSATVDPSTIKQFVNCSGREDIGGGVWIKGQINFENNAVFDPNFPRQLIVAEGSYLEIHIVGQHDTLIPVGNGGKRVPILIPADPYESQFQGNFINLAFQDQRGKVFLEGRIENGIFSGAFLFENYSDWQGSSQGYSGQMGFFEIYACSLLNCG